MVCLVCPDLATCRQEKDCRAAPQLITSSMAVFFDMYGPDCPKGPGTNPIFVVNHGAEGAPQPNGTPRE